MAQITHLQIVDDDIVQLLPFQIPRLGRREHVGTCAKASGQCHSMFIDMRNGVAVCQRYFKVRPGMSDVWATETCTRCGLHD
jgi:hypothetical protein